MAETRSPLIRGPHLVPNAMKPLNRPLPLSAGFSAVEARGDVSHHVGGASHHVLLAARLD